MTETTALMFDRDRGAIGMPDRRRSAGTGVSLIAAAAGALGVPAALWVVTLIIGVVLFLDAMLPRPSGRKSKELTPPECDLESDQQRNYVALNASELMRPFRDFGPEKAARLIRPYLGSWTQIEGVVPDPTIFEWDLGQDVALGRRQYGTASLYLFFPPSDPLKTKKWRPGERVKAIGRIDEIGPSGIVFKDCEVAC